MKRILLLLSITFMIGCSQDVVEGLTDGTIEANREETVLETITIRDVKNHFRPSYQTFTWFNQGDTTIVCEQGTIFTFKANSFYFGDGSKITQPIEFRIKEFYSNSEFISENLSTMSGDKFLETGGMFYVGVYSGNTELKLKDGYDYTIKVPRRNKTAEMGLYYGNKSDDSVRTWLPAGNMINKSFKNYGNFNANAIPGSTDTTVNYYTVARNLVRDGVPYGFHLAKWRLEDTTQTVLSYVKSRLDSNQNLLRTTFLSKHEPVYKLTFDRRGNCVNVGADFGRSSIYGREVTDILTSMPPLYMKDYNDPKAYKVFNLWLTTKKKVTRIKVDMDSLNAVMAQNKDSIDPNAMDFYFLQSSELGWINCDRFYETRQDRTNYVVKVDDPSITKIYLVFSDIESMMYPSKANSLGYVFEHIPMGKNVKIIGIKDNDGMAQICTKTTVVGRAAVPLSNFRSVSLDEMKEIIDAI